MAVSPDIGGIGSSCRLSMQPRGMEIDSILILSETLPTAYLVEAACDGGH